MSSYGQYPTEGPYLGGGGGPQPQPAPPQEPWPGAWQGLPPQQPQPEQVYNQPQGPGAELPPDLFAPSPRLPPPPQMAAAAHYGPEPKKGTIFIVIGVVLLLIGILVISVIPMMAKTPADFERWLASGPGEGESMEVAGVIEKKGTYDLLGQKVVTYKFKDCSECTFYGSVELTDGSYQIMTIEMHEGMPQVRSTTRFEVCIGISLPLMIFGVVLMVFGLLRARKRKAWLVNRGGAGAYPNQPVQPQPQYQYQQQQQYPPNPPNPPYPG